MADFREAFIEFALAEGVLRFGEFELKSGRVSPYFFNAGLFNSGAALAELGRYYARSITEAGIDFDMLLGPAYKGIPLAATTAMAFASDYGRDVPFAYNRKEAKDHGEGGELIGAPLAGRVLIIDDVISAGTSVGESVALIHAAGASLAGVALALDRQERGAGRVSAVEEVARRHAAPVSRIITLDDLLASLTQDARRSEVLAAMRAYRERYG